MMNPIYERWRNQLILARRRAHLKLVAELQQGARDPREDENEDEDEDEKVGIFIFILLLYVFHL